MTKTLISGMAVFSSPGSRPSQEDHLICSQERGIFVVADGFGGPVAGAAASRAACEAVRGFLEKEAGDADATMPFVLRSYFSLAGNVLFNALVHANRKVMLLNRDKNVNEKGGASVIAGYLDGDLLALANVGACSAWLMRGDQSSELVTPRTYARLADPGAENPARELRAPLMALGMAEDLEPEIFEYRVRPGDWLLLHTDGLESDQRARLLDLKSRRQGTAEDALKILKAGLYEDNTSASLMIF